MMEGNQTYQQDFDRIFSLYKEKRIAVYGTGQNARLIAEQVSGYEIAGFISRDGTEGELTGQRILLLEDAVKKADIIIIAATAASTNIIYSRIKDIVPLKIRILDLYGTDLHTRALYESNSYWKKDYGKLCQEIDRHTVISFDIFDTLVMRMVLKPEDIFEIVEKKYNSVFQKGGFKIQRMAAERTCALSKCAPSFSEIYQVLMREYNLDDQSVKQLEIWETEQEKKYIIPRNVMVEAYRYAVSRGKKVYFTSDMYFSSTRIRKLLEQCGIKENCELLVSCEQNAAKKDGSLYIKLKEKAGKEKILHIGDHEILDGKNAEENGIDSYRVLSAHDLLAASSFACIFDCLQTKEDENYLGYFVSEMLNNPFALSKYRGKIPLSTYRDIALAIYPMTLMFINYIMEHARKYECIVFPSRDGFFLYQLYNRIRHRRKDQGFPETKYVYASRTALSRAAVLDEESFGILLDKLFSNGTLNCREYIRNQLDIKIPEEYNVSGRELIQKWGKAEAKRRLYQYCGNAAEKLKEHRTLYKKYLENSGLNKYRSIAIVDIVSYGTQAYCLSQILEREVDMIVLGTTDFPNAYINNSDRVFSVYGNINKKADGVVYSCSNFSVTHLFLEMLYASTDGQFMGISENGEPIFHEASKYNSQLITGVQRELMRIVEKTEEAGFDYKNISQKFSMGMLQLLFHTYSDMAKELKEQFTFSDPYMGGHKTVNLTDLL